MIFDTAEFAIPGLDPDFRVIVSPWILTVCITPIRLSRRTRWSPAQSQVSSLYQFDY
ncbi:MAG: hypothetical protein ACLTSX_02335 [Collinsella sp.]